MKRKLGILCTHPIQYYSPIFRVLAKNSNVDLTVYYAHKPSAEEQGHGFGKSFEWDVDLLQGYRSEWLANRSRRPGFGHFEGMDTPEIAALIEKEKFDAFLVTGWNRLSFWQAMRACWKTQTPLLVRGDSHLKTEIPWPKKILREFTHRYFIPKFSACLATGVLSAEYFRHFGATRVIRSPHCVDNDWFADRCKKADSKTLRKNYGISEQVVVFLFAGKFEKKKGLMDFLKALELLEARAESKGKVFGFLVGEGVLRKSCEEFSRKRRLPVHFAGFMNQSQMPTAYALADVLVLPSRPTETWGLVVNEAMACGTPAVVSSGVGCGPDLVLPGKTGEIFKFGDVQSLADALQKTMDASKRKSLSKASKELIGFYSLERAAEGIVQAIEVCAA